MAQSQLNKELWYVFTRPFLYGQVSIGVLKNIYGASLNKFPDFFRMGTFIDSTHMKH